MIDQTVKEHLITLLSEVEKNPSEDLIEQASNSWLEKLKIFTSQCHLLKMAETDLFSKENKNGLLALTYSGSLVALYPETTGRQLEYASLKLRTNIPGFIKSEQVILEKDACQGVPIHLENSKLQHTSAVYLIMAFDDETDSESQNERLNEAMIYLTGNFIKLNISAITSNQADIEKFDMKSIVRFISSRVDLTQTQTKSVIKEYINLVEVILSIGEHVRLGQLGTIKPVKKSPRQARILKNPQTGKDITIPAAGERMGAKMVFSKNLKEKLLRLDPNDFD